MESVQRTHQGMYLRSKGVIMCSYLQLCPTPCNEQGCKCMQQLLATTLLQCNHRTLGASFVLVLAAASHILPGASCTDSLHRLLWQGLPWPYVRHLPLIIFNSKQDIAPPLPIVIS